MAEVILANVLNSKISVDNLFEWLTTDNPEETVWPDIIQNGYTRAEFISFFLGYLREQCRSILSESKDAQEKQANKAILTAQLNKNAEKGRDQLADSPAHGPHHITPRHHVTSSPEQFYGPTGPKFPGFSGHNLEPDEPGPYCGKAAISNPGSPYRGDPFSPYSQLQQSPLHCHHSSNLTSGGPSSRLYPQNNQQSATYCFPPVGSSSPNSQLSSSFSNASSETFNYNQIVHQSQLSTGANDISSSSETSENNFTNASIDTNSPRRFHISDRSGSNVPFSPVSPLYADNIPTLYTRKSDRSLNDISTTHNYSAISANSSKTATPINGMESNSGHKSVKPAPNQSWCLADFITINEKSSKKDTKKKKHSQTKVVTGRKLQSGDKSSSSPQNKLKQQRRINPTRLEVAGNKEGDGKDVFGVISRPQEVNPTFVEAPSTDKSQEEITFEAERNLLKLERKKQPLSATVPETSKVEQKLSKKSDKQQTVVPCLDLVENVESLNTLAVIYIGILDRNLMTNPMTELYFLVMLLTSQYKPSTSKKLDDGSDESSSLEDLIDELGCAELNAGIRTESTERELIKRKEDIKDKLLKDDRKELPEYLGTAHNCVYFATMVMVNQKFLLSTLDRVTLKLLCENHQIATFQPDLQKYLNEIYTAKCSQANRVTQTDERTIQGNVCFQVDTDNRETFTSTVASSIFCKQRDLFYDILKDWEDNHLSPGWSFDRGVRHKVHTLLNLSVDPVNYCHLAKLFISQLLMSSVQNEQMEDPIEEEYLSFFKSLKDLNPDKLKQLKGRFVTPLTSTGPVPQPKFLGVQELYQKFIENALRTGFYTILEMNLIHDIIELNETKFVNSEIEGTETMVDESTKQHFSICVSRLRLLAKFASFTLHLPYVSASNSQEWCVSQIKLRSRVLPALNLQTCLLDAIANGRLALTVPWIVQYMAMLDTVSLRLPYYINIGQLLYCIYRASDYCHMKELDKLMSPQTATLMMFTIGWLFELPNLPRDLYTSWQINYDQQNLRALSRSSDELSKNQVTNTEGGKPSKEFIKYKPSLDKLDIIDDRTLYECCPFLAEFKVLLISGNAVLGNSNANRHITPVSSQLSQPTCGVKTKNLQMQLEDAFFHGQPSSIKKTVDFVSERVASSCVKYIYNTIIPSVKQRNMEIFVKSENGEMLTLTRAEENDEDRIQTPPGKSPSKINRKLQAEILERAFQHLSVTIMEDIKKDCGEKMPDKCESLTIKAIDSLLPDDINLTVKETCIAITARKANNRIQEWIDAHIVEAQFRKNITFEVNRFAKYGSIKQMQEENQHTPEIPYPTDIIEDIRRSMWELLEGNQQWTLVTQESVTNILTALHQCLSQQSDLDIHTEKNLRTLSLDFCLLLMARRSNFYSSAIQQQFINIWKTNTTRDGEGLFARILCPRNVEIIAYDKRGVGMKSFAGLIKALMKEQLLTLEAFSDQCIAVLRNDWATPILKQLGKCINEIAADLSGTSAADAKFFIDWVAMSCGRIEDSYPY